MNGRVVALLALFGLAACAHSSMVLLPDENGGHGQVAILKPDGTGETLVSEANSRATLSATPAIHPLGSKGLKPTEAALLASLPPPPKSFTLYFLEGTTEMTEKSAPLLDEIKAEIAGRPGAEVQVTGHTDTVGSDADNDALSQKRAEEIMSLLASKGFDRTIMSAVGRGERELQVPTDDNVSSPVNRRVEVIVR
ncbi:OmpA family protein [Sphingomonas hankyongi]|uniref:OmpA family protein n=1 Tax=Sphingomonas hankyongi TaxID=2908209 RepID=A0ABT0S218_9SPHN|nr:OmpA family protein [Sphingomonas hankyongi]